MWNPYYFNGSIAVHGLDSVPSYPASHGCARIPMHIADYFYTLVHQGESVFVVGTPKQPGNGYVGPCTPPPPPTTTDHGAAEDDARPSRASGHQAARRRPRSRTRPRPAAEDHARTPPKPTHQPHVSRGRRTGRDWWAPTATASTTVRIPSSAAMPS